MMPYLPLRWTTNYKLGKTESFRLSSSKLFSYWGTNLQNVPDSVRRLVIPDPGREFIQVDQSGAEALIVAYLCGAGKFRQLFENGIKSHVYVAMHLFKDFWAENGFPEVHTFCELLIEELRSQARFYDLVKAIKHHATYYLIGKKTCHAANYGMRGPTFATTVLKETEGKVRISVREATHFLDEYHRLFPEIRNWHSDIQRQISRNRTLRNLFGFPRVFGGPLSTKLFMEANSFIPQSTVGTITNIAFTELQTWIEENQPEVEGWDLLNNCHDSYLMQVPIGEGMFAANIMKHFLEKDLVAPDGTRFKMKSEASIGMNWGKYSDKSNPEGLREIQ
jgi:DNA polymerase I-like protein with 3'-5' exonuclease and polymerase domains